MEDLTTTTPFDLPAPGTDEPSAEEAAYFESAPAPLSIDKQNFDGFDPLLSSGAEDFLASLAPPVEVVAPVESPSFLTHVARQIPPKGFFLTGLAGTGKSYQVQRTIEANPGKWKLCATTGIAAANLGPNVTTIHSALKFGDDEWLEEAFIKGALQREIRKLKREGYLGIILDEVSMLKASALDMLVRASMGSTEWGDKEDEPFWWWLVGDFAQLRPIATEDKKTGKKIPGTDKYAFEADCWPEIFEPNVCKLTKVWRQSNPLFLDALNAARRGDGFAAANLLQQAGVRFSHEADPDFLGTTIMAKNDEVDNYNWVRLAKLPGTKQEVPAQFWGTPQILARMPSDWRIFAKNPCAFKSGALVMILINDTDDWEYVNGDLATVRGWDAKWKLLEVEMLNPRSAEAKVQQIPLVTRYAMFKEPPEPDSVPGFDAKRAPRIGREEPIPWGQICYLKEKGRWVHGACEYLPVRLAWASTCHKTQGLSMDHVQLNPQANFFGQPAMMYVALSRARSPEGLRIVGDPGLVAMRVKSDPKVERWL